MITKRNILKLKLAKKVVFNGSKCSIRRKNSTYHSVSFPIDIYSEPDQKNKYKSSSKILLQFLFLVKKKGQENRKNAHRLIEIAISSPVDK